ncbi:MAG: TonB-dependent receptor [Bacteroidetes bacterium]|nr:TonB-dependent receptor [Bacteroidota bacterium]
MRYSLPAFLLFIATIFWSNPLLAQNGMKGPGGGRQGGKLGKMYGKVIDAKTGRPVSIASVSLLKTEDGKQILAQGGITADNGEFSFDGLPLNEPLELVISALGYSEFKKSVSFDLAALMKAGAAMKNAGASPDANANSDSYSSLLDATNKDLGNIQLQPSSQNLKGVTVTASQPAFELQGEKKIFNVSQDLNSQGGTAADVMKNVPGVLVDADNNVSIRNSAPLVLVDGRQSPLTLDQIPSDAIDKVEVITNPSAKYDAEGGPGGILNIVLKKNRKTGYNGSVRAGADSRGGTNLGGNFNARSGKINISFDGNASLRNGFEQDQTDRYENYGGRTLQSHQDGESNRGGAFFFGKLGLDYFATNRTSFSLGLLKMHGEHRPDQSLDMTTDTLLANGMESTGWASRNTGGKSTFDMNGIELSMKHLFPRAGEEWNVEASARGGNNSGQTNYSTRYFTGPEESAVSRNLAEQTNSSGSNNFYSIQSDYSRPFAQKDKLEVGVKASVRTTDSRIINSIQDSAGNMIPTPFGTNYNSSDQVYAAYASYSGNFGTNNSYQIGLRAESSNYLGALPDSNLNLKVSYPISLFPSLAYTRMLGGQQQLQFSYRRGIRRPSFFQLMPYVDYSDPLNIREGNPSLRPEFTNSVELSYMKNFTRSNYILFTLYERHSDNLITNLQTLGLNQFSGENAIITTPVNAGSSDRYGGELTVGWDLSKWWNTTANANLYNGQLNDNSGSSSSYFSGFGKLNNQFRFGGGWSAQLSGVYQSRTNILASDASGGHGFNQQNASTTQGYLEAQWFTDASLKKTFLKNNTASLTLSVNDIFGTRKFVQHTESDFFVQDYSRISNPTMFRLSFNWRFGKQDTDLFRRKNMKAQMDNMQDASQSMGM